MTFSPDSSDDDVISEINMTPLVDVMLVLLIIFMITMPVLTQSVLVQLPQTSAKPAVTQPDSIAISVLRDGTVLWGSEVVTAAQLQQRLRQVAAQPQQASLQLMADKAVQYQHVLTVMALAQQLGISQLGFVTEPASAGEPQH
ncbi:MAG: biopolymer transporter ExbD [Gammaproteobacteria bacterium]|nr:biopolymer transporter ExbD [Gammaproteobacteria bacterium]MBU1554522.1 biopolymer transporter ExbD [Gammaproteobacteria bacterium]MBU2071026.1 biopolymer transporter ExbD [Gammaproteobacteria bacterium]MBU2184294.1 biopolymer transporter ExbD [Gammaproteobacteria bacterium]MBU2206449.1 biopolymer transporter ExbD [Gammaproteobacteria bacterium]